MARHNLEQAQAELVNATLDYERKRSLVESGGPSRVRPSTRPRRASGTARAVVEALTAAGNAARAALQEAEVQLENTNIRAPFDGASSPRTPTWAKSWRRSRRRPTRGAVVKIADMGSLQVEADVSESNIARWASASPCEITLDAYPGAPYRGKREQDRPHRRPCQGDGD